MQNKTNRTCKWWINEIQKHTKSVGERERWRKKEKKNEKQRTKIAVTISNVKCVVDNKVKYAYCKYWSIRLIGYIKPPCNNHSVYVVWVHKYTDVKWKNMTGSVENRKSGRKESKVIIKLIPFHSFPLSIHFINLQNSQPTEKEKKKQTKRRFLNLWWAHWTLCRIKFKPSLMCSQHPLALMLCRVSM